MYSKKVIIVVSLILSLIIFLCTNFFVAKIKDNSIETIITTEEVIENNIEKQESEETKETKEETNKIEKWQIEIPIISLIAPIAEGTEMNILNEYVGHFKITPKIEGNIGLAAHNRGYPVNYFKDLKKLKKGDKIIYTYGEKTKTYEVITNIQISDIEWRYLENTTENTLTLITCIENKPEYRRCVQAIESKEK